LDRKKNFYLPGEKDAKQQAMAAFIYCGKNPVDTREYPSYIHIVKKQYFIILFALSILLVSCLNRVMEKPSFVIREITLKPRSLTEMTLLIGLDVKNPNCFDLTFKSFEYTVYLNNQEIGSGHLEQEILIPSSSTTRVMAPVTAELKNWGGSVVKAIITGDKLLYKIEGKTNIQTVLGGVILPFSQEGHLN
jgi:LEA14-like dessication related protein